LSAAGVGTLRLIRRKGALPATVATAIVSSNPEIQIENRAWPTAEPGLPAAASGAAWLSAIAGTTVVVRSGFDDDSMLRAAVRMAVPVIVMRGREDGIDVVSFRQHGPCPHAALDVPERPGVAPDDGAGAVVAAHIAAAEALVLIARAHTGGARARHVTIPLRVDQSEGDGAAGAAQTPAARAVDIPWAPECFACGGSGVEMSFA
jgi:hypothetical protein